MGRSRWLLLAVACTAIAVAGALLVYTVRAGSGTKDEATAPGTTAQQAPAQLVYIDENGKRIVPPPGAARSIDSPVVSRSPAGAEYPNPGPGGGMVADLKGRFRTYSVATKAPDGTVSIQQVQGADRAQAMVEEHRNGDAAPAHDTEE